MNGACAIAVGAAVLAALGTSAGASPAARGVAVPAFRVAADPAWSPDGSTIAFVAHRGRVGTLYLLRVDGGGVRRVLARPFDARWPSWSPDGRQIAFEHRSGPASGPSSDVYVVDIDGTGLRKVVSDAREPAWGPGGTRIAFAREGRLGNDRIWTVSPDGTRPLLAAESRHECRSYSEPTWSPDGERVAFAVGSAGGECGSPVFVGATRAFGGRVRVLARGWFEEPAWSPDGSALAVTRPPLVGGEPRHRVAVVDLRSRRARYLRAGWHPRWSPDARRLVLARGNPFGPSPRSWLALMNADGSRIRRLTR